jgi:putative (di)nucleoside polyphosphate hydrolase
MKLRPNVAMVILNDENKILIGERSDIKNSWQLPQGGIDKGETPQTAMWRELFEETSLTKNDVEIIAQTDPIPYIFPKNINYFEDYKGQNQIFFLLKTKNKISPTPNEEFSRFTWETKEKILNLIIDFKKASYKKAFEEFFGEKR